MKTFKILILLIIGFSNCLKAQQKPKVYIAYGDERARNNALIKAKGIETVGLIHGSCFPKKIDQKIDLSKVEKEIAKQFPNQSQTGLMVLDWEGEWYKVLAGKSRSYDSQSFSNVINQYIEVLEYVKKLRPNMKVSYYGIPLKTFNVNESKLITQNTRIIALIKKMDFLAPSLYFFNNNTSSDVINSNKNSINANLKVFSKIKSIVNKPLYVFIWNRWHPNSDNDKGDLIPVNTFNAIINKTLTYNTNNNIDGLIWYLTDYTVAAFKSKLLMNSKVQQFSSKSSLFLKKNFKSNPVNFQNEVFNYYYDYLKGNGTF